LVLLQSDTEFDHVTSGKLQTLKVKGSKVKVTPQRKVLTVKTL